MKILQKHPKRISFREFLPWFGLLATLAVYMFLPNLVWFLPGCYGMVLIIEGIRSSIRFKRFSTLLGVPFCLVMLHTSFSLGLVDGVLRKGRAPSDR